MFGHDQGSLFATRLRQAWPALLLAVACAAIPSTGAAAASDVITIRPPAPGSPQDAASKAIEQGLARARSLKAARPGLAITIRFSTGIYRLSRPMVLKAEDSGVQTAPLRLIADGPVRITGAQILTLAPIKSGDATSPANPASGHLTTASLDEGRAPFFEPRGNWSPAHPESVLLVQNGAPLAIARWPKAGYAKADPVGDRSGPHVTPVFQVPAAKAGLWAHEPYLWAGGYWTYDWAFETAPVRNVDDASNDMRLGQSATAFDQADSFRYFVFNAASEIDAPGEYAITQQGKLTLWPHIGTPVESAELEQLLRIEGAHDIALSGFIFDDALGDAVTVDNSSRIVFADGLVRNTGGNGIVVSGGDHDRIERMVIADTGESGVSLTGGDRRTLLPAGHIVSDSIILRFARLTRTYRAAVLLQGVGNMVTGCYLAHGPHMAVLFSGNDHVITGNEIADVVLETGDAGVIYAGRDVFSRGTLIAGNYLHDIGGNSGLDVRGIYLDDFLGGNSVKGNLFVDMHLPVFLNSGSGNQVSGNIFVQPMGAAVTVRDSSDTWDEFQGDLYRNARPAFVAQPLYRARYGDAAMSFNQPRPLHNRIGPNLVFGGRDFATDHGASQADQDLMPPTQLSPRRLSGKSLGEIATAVEIGNAKAVFPFAFDKADRKTALKDLRYASRALP